MVEMKELLASASRAVNRFIPIGDDGFVALTEDVRARCQRGYDRRRAVARR